MFAIFVTQSFNVARKIPVTFAIFAKFAAFTKPFLAFSPCQSRILKNLSFLLFRLLNLFTKQKKFFLLLRFLRHLLYFFYTFLIAVFFKSFLLKLRKQFASKFLLTRSILDTSGSPSLLPLNSTSFPGFSPTRPYGATSRRENLGTSS